MELTGILTMLVIIMGFGVAAIVVGCIIFDRAVKSHKKKMEDYIVTGLQRMDPDSGRWVLLDEPK